MSTSDERPKKQATVPSGRFARLARLGSLATSVAGGMLAEGARQLAQGKRPKLQSMILTPANARRVADQLARLRGAAMKVGQLLSMDAGDFLPKELSDILARLRSDAASMPMKQLEQVLISEWGPQWNQNFSQFCLSPFASASIGQVHRAVTHDGTELAIKVQYPGVRQSINSDVDNVASLLRLSGLLPSSLDIKPLLEEAKQQLHAEADYLLEAKWLSRFNQLIPVGSNFTMPVLNAELTTANILAMTWVDGVPIEALVSESQTLRDRVASQLFELLLKELFEFQLIQTDPNFANFRFNVESQQVVLLDFGACREYAQDMVENYRTLLSAASRNNLNQLSEAAKKIGYFGDAVTDAQHRQILQMFQIAFEPMTQTEPYDFGHSDIPERLHAIGMQLALDKDFWHTPPINALLLHRKLGGLFLLSARLKARIDIHSMIQPYLL